MNGQRAGAGLAAVLAGTLGACSAPTDELAGPIPAVPPPLNPGTYTGCVATNATDPIAQWLIGLELTGESCTVTVHPDGSVETSMRPGRSGPMRAHPALSSDTFLAMLAHDQGYLIQHGGGRRLYSVRLTEVDDTGRPIVPGLTDPQGLRECMMDIRLPCDSR